MPRYEIEVTYDLTTEVEPEGEIELDLNEVEEWSDDSRFYGESMTLSGGNVSFTIEADGEEEAREAVNVMMNAAHYSGDSLEWEIADFDITITAVEEPMNMDRARELIRAFLDRVDNLDDDTKAAFNFVLDTLTP